MNIPENLQYTADHEWVRVVGNTITLGITDFAQDALGDVVYVELPDVGSTAKSGEAMCEVESTKSVSDIIAPVDGSVTKVNDALGDDPAVLNSDPYEAGWICEIELSNASQLDDLLDAAAYGALTAS
ncbi:MAG: glycine cleavage system H protein [Verrucomicrobiales bacterium]|jgi:glycine cleavage system H protein